MTTTSLHTTLPTRSRATLARGDKRHRRNVARLALWLREHERRIWPKFDITHFCVAGNGYPYPRPSASAKLLAHTCGTTACLLGFGPSAGIKPKRRESWEAYGIRCFGAIGVTYSWLFHGGHVDCIKAGLRRMSWFLEGRALPPLGSITETPTGYRCNWQLMERLAR